MSESAEAREWHRVIRTSVCECLETWVLQAQTGSVSVEALEAILARATVPILRQLEERQPALVVAPSAPTTRTPATPEQTAHAAHGSRGHDTIGEPR